MEKGIKISKVDFYGSSISLVKKDGIEYVAMKPIVENIGLDWKSQHKKLTDNKEKYGCGDITIPSKGGDQSSLCIPLKKMNGYLFTINPEKVKPEIKNKVILYQEECFTVLHDYFNHGYSLNNNLLASNQGKRDKLSKDLRRLRVSDVDLYRKLTDAISFTCVDYKSKDGKEIGKFFASLQDSFHFAVSGFTASELVFHNIDCNKPNVGMIAFSGNENKITQADVKTGKNYLDDKAFRRFEILYDQLLSFVEMKVMNGDEMTLDSWKHQLNSIIIANGLNPFPGYQSKINRSVSNPKAINELKKFKQFQITK